MTRVLSGERMTEVTTGKFCRLFAPASRVAQVIPSHFIVAKIDAVTITPREYVREDGIADRVVRRNRDASNRVGNTIARARFQSANQRLGAIDPHRIRESSQVTRTVGLCSDQVTLDNRAPRLGTNHDVYLTAGNKIPGAWRRPSDANIVTQGGYACPVIHRGKTARVSPSVVSLDDRAVALRNNGVVPVRDDVSEAGDVPPIPLSSLSTSMPM